ncbi:hypothetical protein [Pelagicoccus sp. SDUM812003]|uniref:hypothetical protein n=1 Tax=Pelagicoccus sp. SDUM812003 TaxID=3041267 RepID=UPI00280D3608|nr:hypothetical protein [Pelagicoccus sp. SDUM812003]MDQ8205707.1 hypothetical protein [Pelagicoccus sp. SDUM812003]
MKKTNKTEDESAKTLSFPIIMIALGVTVILLKPYNALAIWFFSSAIFLFWLFRKEINKTTITNGITHAGFGALICGAVIFVAPWAGLYGPHDRKDSYPIFIFGILLYSVGYTLRIYLLKKKT